MLTYLARRLLYAVLTFFGITIAVFALVHAVPGDPIAFFIGKNASAHLSNAAIDAIRHEYHLDRPIPEQYLWWLRGVVTLDFGRSIVDHRDVAERILEKLPNTFQLNVIALLVAAIAGVPLGLWSATRSGRSAERGSAVFFFLLYSLPSFWVALLLVRLFSVRWQVLPLIGMVSDDYAEMSAGAQILDRVRHLLLPVVTLSYAQVAVLARFSKSAFVEVISQDFITTARAKGAGSAVVLWRHAFRNALMPLITLLGLTIPYLISGSVIVEQIFQWDGVGRLYFDSIMLRDYPTVLALSVATAVVTLFASVLADLLYAIADPRVRLEGRRR
ncbi:MAG TPA: ABC transporter permease [Thermoanaerobaculia bacterium]|nr:ABC transporter permease [Thermoanaerobaculia bacterium]